MTDAVTIVGGGFAGVEAAWQVAERGVAVTLYEMRPVRNTPAHKTPDLAEPVCSNSLKADSLATASGLLKAELRAFDSLILQAADATRVPAGQALAVNREEFAREVTRRIDGHPRISVVREEVRTIPPGETRSYAWLANEAGNARAARGAGQAMARNRWPLLVPCHRVIASDGSLRGFGGGSGLPLKAQLLALEEHSAAASP